MKSGEGNLLYFAIWSANPVQASGFFVLQDPKVKTLVITLR